MCLNRLLTVAVFLQAVSGQVESESFGGRDDNICRNREKLAPHQFGLWNEDFPYSDPEDVTPLCKGDITVNDDGSICVEGRVTFNQIMEKIDGGMYAPANPTISVNGQLTSGSGNVVFGPRAQYLYDFITTYTVNNVTYEANSTMIDNLLAASRGTIDGFCLSAAITEGPDRYTITRNFHLPGGIEGEDIEDASIIFASFHSIYVEFHRGKPKEWTDIFWMPFSWLGLTMNNIITRVPLPSFSLNFIPGFLGLTGITRTFLVWGIFSSRAHPQPLIAPDLQVENWQLDCAWTTLQAAIDDGLFYDYRIPVNLGVIIKKIASSSDTNGCWTTDSASIDIQAPNWQSDMLDDYVLDELYPTLSEHGPVGVHFGKRLVSDSWPLWYATEIYRNCGAGTNLDLSEEECYHPACNRDGYTSYFTYPEEYFRVR